MVTYIFSFFFNLVGKTLLRVKRFSKCCEKGITCLRKRKLRQRASFCTFDHRFVQLLSLCLGDCLSFVVCGLSKNSSAVHSAVVVCAGDSHLLFKLRNVLKHTLRAEAPWLAIKISKKTFQQPWRFSPEIWRRPPKPTEIISLVTFWRIELRDIKRKPKHFSSY